LHCSDTIDSSHTSQTKTTLVSKGNCHFLSHPKVCIKVYWEQL